MFDTDSVLFFLAYNSSWLVFFLSYHVSNAKFGSFFLFHRLFPFWSVYKFLSQYGISGGWLKGWSGDFQTKNKKKKKTCKEKLQQEFSSKLKETYSFSFLDFFLFRHNKSVSSSMYKSIGNYAVYGMYRK